MTSTAFARCFWNVSADNTLVLTAFNFPALSVMARQYLGVPATSASAERLFSLAGRAFDDLRQGMKEEMLKMLMWARRRGHSRRRAPSRRALSSSTSTPASGRGRRGWACGKAGTVHEAEVTAILGAGGVGVVEPIGLVRASIGAQGVGPVAPPPSFGRGGFNR